jgi:hypothetical protein
VCLRQYNTRLEHGVMEFFVRASGVCLTHGLARPAAEDDGLGLKFGTAALCFNGLV